MKKLFLIVFAVVLILALSACSAGTSPSAGVGETAAQPAATPEPTQAPAEKYIYYHYIQQLPDLLYSAQAKADDENSCFLYLVLDEPLPKLRDGFYILNDEEVPVVIYGPHDNPVGQADQALEAIGESADSLNANEGWFDYWFLLEDSSPVSEADRAAALAAAQ